MIISKTLKYVYVAIGRNGSKSMNRWLMDHYEGEWYGTHHAWRVPEEAKDYLIFTLVRNPYERTVSGWFAIPWIDPPQDRPLPANQFGEEMRRLLRLRQSQPEPGDEEEPLAPMTQQEMVEGAGVSLVLYHEWLPDCLTALPFVDTSNVAPFPHIEEAGQRPAGSFFDIFGAEDEKLVWAYSQEDFEAFGYQRFDSGRPAVTHKWLE